MAASDVRSVLLPYQTSWTLQVEMAHILHMITRLTKDLQNKILDNNFFPETYGNSTHGKVVFLLYKWWVGVIDMKRALRHVLKTF